METFFLLTLNQHPVDRLLGEPASTTPNPVATDDGFGALGISPKLVAVLKRAGISSPFPVQTLTIPDALAGRDVCGKARTGSGKTLAFGLPLIERTAKSAPRRPQSIVLVPTRELASQIVRELAPLAAVRGVRILAVYGGVSLNRQAQLLRTGIDIVIATPGRFNDLIERTAVSVDDVRIAVLDEADQMADLGFMPQVQRILSRIERPHQTLLFSATLDGAVDELVKRYQHEPVFHTVVTPEEEAPDMKHRFIGVPEDQKVAVAADIAAGPNRTLMFVRTQRGADRLVRLLDGHGIHAGVIHGGLSQAKRERALAAFSKGFAPVLVATNIAARGIHVDGVDIVIHHDPPEDTKTFLHRSGRTARAGASGLVITLVAPEQLRDVNAMRREANVPEAVVPMEAGDARLADLGAWQPPLDDLSVLPNVRPQGVQRPFRPRRPAPGQQPRRRFEDQPRQHNGGGSRPFGERRPQRGRFTGAPQGR